MASTSEKDSGRSTCRLESDWSVAANTCDIKDEYASMVDKVHGILSIKIFVRQLSVGRSFFCREHSIPATNKGPSANFDY